MGRILIYAGSALCVAGIGALILAVCFFGKQRSKLIDRINNEYREG